MNRVGVRRKSRNVCGRHLLTMMVVLCLDAAILAACSASTGAPPKKPRALVTTAATASTTATGPLSGAPVKGLTDNPAYQWWQRPNSPEPDSWWGDDQTPQTLEAQLALMQQLGVRVFRVELVWPFVAPQMPGGAVYDGAQARDPSWIGYNWQRWDEIVQLATQAGIQLVPMVVYTPAWAADATLAQPVEPNTPPASPQYFADFLTAAAARYQGRIHYWELWNEPDFTTHTWNGTLQQYVDLVLKPGYLAVKQVDANARVLLGGLAGDTNMNAMYAAGAKPYFDIANFHAYFPASQGIATAVDHVESAMHANGDDAKPIWLSEFGMVTHPSLTNGDPSTVTPETSNETAQAKLITGVYQDHRLQAILFYQLHDTAVYGPGTTIQKYVYWGLVSRDFTHKKAGFAAYQAAPSGVLAMQVADGRATGLVLAPCGLDLCLVSAFPRRSGRL